MFFKYHGEIQYNIFGNDFQMTDITKSSVSLNASKNSLQQISVNSRTPEQVAADIYNDPKLYWTILYINNVVDPFLDWHMMEDQLYEYCIRLYTEEGMQNVRYFENRLTKEIITGDEATSYYEMMENDIQLPEHINYVTNYAYEQLKNESKKMIKVIPPAMISKFVEEFKSKLKGK